MNKSHTEISIFESIFKTKKDRHLIISFSEFLQNLTGLDVNFYLHTQSVDNKKIISACYALNDTKTETFVFIHFNAKSIITTLNSMFNIIDHAHRQPDVDDLASMLNFIERKVDLDFTALYIIQQFREIMIFISQSNPDLMKQFLDTRDYLDEQSQGAPKGTTLH